ncbi:deoxyribonuclease NucA/NucB-domain-containing protein [Apiospora arundinis]
MQFTTVALLTMAVSAATAKSINYDCNDTPQICLNTCWAIKCARVSADMHGGGQTQATSKRYRDNNRQSWGFGSRPCAKGSKHKKWWRNGKTVNSSPDEYPYAASREGGRFGPGNPVQLRCVPKKEQQRQGGKLSGLALAGPNDVWTTTWSNIGGLPRNWCGQNPTCTNDGHQFTATSKGKFTRSLDVAAEDVPVFEDAVYEANSTTITMRAADVAEQLEEIEELDDGVEARDVDEAGLDMDDVADVEEEEEGSEGVEARDEKLRVAFQA